MPKRVLRLNPFQAQRLVNKHKHESSVSLEERVKAALQKEVEYPAFAQADIDRMKANFPGSVAEDYMRSRGFTDETLDYFDVGYSAVKGMVVVPMHDPKGNPVGIIGRTPSSEVKQFKNSQKLPKSKTSWNFHRAKRVGDSVIICEASYDAMRIHQAGFPNVVALLGGHITQWHVQQLGRTFSTVTIMTDFDKLHYYPRCNLCRSIKFEYNQVKCVGHRPGRDLGRSIVKAMPNKRVLWGAYDDTCVYPHEAKDASDMTDAEIRQCIKNAIPNLSYATWNIERSVA